MRKRRKYLVIHCTDTPAGRYTDRKDIDQWHLKERGWSQVGYEKLYLLDGTVQVLVENNGDHFVDPWEITNGVRGINSIAMHWCYVGGKGGDTRTKEQRVAMRKDIQQLVKDHPDILIGGHNQFDIHKTCPSFNVRAWLKAIGIPAKNIY
jgi:N-acetylmuramoyl-L-alanine amidase